MATRGMDSARLIATSSFKHTFEWNGSKVNYLSYHGYKPGSLNGTGLITIYNSVLSPQNHLAGFVMVGMPSPIQVKLVPHLQPQ